MSSKEQKAKIVKTLHAVADKIGKGVRKGGPLVLGLGLGLLAKWAHNGDSNKSNKA